MKVFAIIPELIGNYKDTKEDILNKAVSKFAENRAIVANDVELINDTNDIYYENPELCALANLGKDILTMCNADAVIRIVTPHRSEYSVDLAIMARLAIEHNIPIDYIFVD